MQRGQTDTLMETYRWYISVIRKLRLCRTPIVWFGLVLTIFNEGAYLTFKSIFHKALKLLLFDCEIMLESVPGTNQY